MTNIDLSNYDLGELKNLQVEIEQAMKDRQQQEIKEARELIRSIAQDLGMSVEELLADSGAKPKGNKAQKAQPQYKNPADSSQTWSGRGRQPKWIADGLASGKSLDEFRI